MNKPIKKIISEYVERKDIYGLAEYFRAYIEDELLEELNAKDALHEKTMASGGYDSGLRS